MSHFEGRLVQEGYEGLVLVSSDKREEVTGFNDEHVNEVFAARKGAQSYRLKCYALIRVFKNDEYSVRPEEISAEQYVELARGELDQ